ncbi:MAG TPA: hypothetical protein DGT23_17860 [Micromonosporaceae bacterium]|nr:hypothetical protein [Micromonosporaceae bacterium]
MDFELLVKTQDGLIAAGQCRDLGISADKVKHWVRERSWRVITRGVYLVDVHMLEAKPLTPRRLIRAAQLALGPHAVIVLESAAELLGIEGLRRGKQIHVSLEGPYARPRRLGNAVLVPHQLVLRSTDVMEIDGMRVTSAARTVADLMLKVRRYEAISALDHALNRALISEDELPILYQMMAGRRGVKSARKWLEQADGRAESPLETRARLRCADGGVPPDDLQVLIQDERGVVIARADMLWRRYRLIGEADGEAAHSMPEPIFRDRVRQNALAAAGFSVVRFTWTDTLDPDRIPRIVRAAMRGQSC